MAHQSLMSVRAESECSWLLQVPMSVQMSLLVRSRLLLLVVSSIVSTRSRVLFRHEAQPALLKV